MASDSGHILALTVTPTQLRLGVARRGRRGAAVASRGRAPLDDAALASPSAFCAAVRAALDDAGVTWPAAKSAVVGLPARWVMTRHHPTPPVNDQQRSEIARLQAERLASGVSDRLTTDYQGGGEAGRGVLIAAVATERLKTIAAGLREAGLTLKVAVPTALACPPPTGPGMAVLVEPGAVTAMHAADGRWVAVRDVTLGDGGLTDDAGRHRLVAALRRQAMTGPTAATGRPTVRLLDATGGPPTDLEPLRAAIEDGLGGCTADVVDPVEALAHAAAERDADTINFAAPRLASAPRRAVPRPAKWAAVAAVVLLAVGLIVGGMWWHRSRAVRALDAERADLGERAAALQAVLDDSRAVAGWFDDRPPVLDALLTLSETFPQRRGVWAMRVSLDDEFTGSIQCKSRSRELMLEYLAAMRASPRLDSVVLRDWQEVGRGDGVVVFEIAFRYAPAAGGGDA